MPETKKNHGHEHGRKEMDDKSKKISIEKNRSESPKSGGNMNTNREANRGK